MNIDEMKSNWQSAKGDINPGSELQPGRGRKTALQRLGDQYSRFSRFSLVFMLVSPLMLWIAGIRALWIVAGIALFLGAASVLDYYLALGIRAIDPARMPVYEVLERTMKYRKIHLLWVAIAGPLAILWCAAIALSMRADIYMVCSVCVGTIIGLVLGVRILLTFLRDYRDALRD